MAVAGERPTDLVVQVKNQTNYALTVAAVVAAAVSADFAVGESVLVPFAVSHVVVATEVDEAAAGVDKAASKSGTAEKIADREAVLSAGAAAVKCAAGL